MKNTFYQLWRESTIIQGIIALGTTGVILFLYATQKPVPPELFGIVTAILGFYFGSKNQQSTTARIIENVTRNKPPIDR